MKKVILGISLLAGISLYATDTVDCEKIFKSAIFNFYLENSCKFDKHVSSTIRKEFENKNCPKLFTDADLKSLNNEVLGDSYQEMNNIGRDEFCKNNRVTYYELVKRIN